MLDRSFLSPLNPEVSWLKLDVRDWNENPAATSHERRWARKPGELLSLEMIPGPPDIPFPLDHLDQLRRLERQRLRAADGGLVSLDVHFWGDQPGLVSIAKYPEQGSYQVRLCLPYGGFSFVLRFLAFPYGVRGDRECVALLAAERGGRVPPTSMDGFFQDPYDPSLREGPFTRSLADDEEWDVHFPDHPLTRARGWLGRLDSGLWLDQRLGRAAPFTGQPDSALGFLARARAFKLLEEWPPTLRDSSRALALDPSLDEAWFLRACVHLHNKRWSEAERDLTEAVNLRPGISIYHFHLSLALQCAGREREAVARYSEAQRIDPSYGR